MAQKLGEVYEKLNTIRIAGLFTDTVDEETLADAYGSYQLRPLLKLWEKYGDKYDESLQLLEEKDEEENPEPTEEEQEKISINARKASLAYKGLARVLKYDVLKQTVLDNADHTCLCCEQKFPTKDEFKAERPDKLYPLFVRCHFPIVKYIEVFEIFDVKELIKDKKIFNSKHYSAVCINCKATSMIRKKR